MPRAANQTQSGSAANVVANLGQALLTCPANSSLVGSLREGRLDGDSFYRSLLVVTFRFLVHGMIDANHRLPNQVVADADYGLFDELQATWRLFGTTGAPEQKLPALGGLFAPAQAPALADARLPNSAVRQTIHDTTNVIVRQAPEVLGQVYEQLLPLEPALELEPLVFTLRRKPGARRKRTGTYYTPESLITLLLDFALDPVLAGAPEQIRALKVCDPACGTGHFLLAAARRIARALAPDADPHAYKAALRHALRSCIFGVDIDPFAVELCRTICWLEAGEWTTPIDAYAGQIRVGNGLFGASWRQVTAGVPREAYEPTPGDDLALCTALRKKNKRELRDRPRVGGDLSIPPPLAWRLADTWCSVFVAPKVDVGPVLPTTASLEPMTEIPSSDDPFQTLATKIAEQRRFFHWPLAFPEVFSNHADDSWNGFDVVVGNPPFVNAIEGSIDFRERNFAKYLYPQLGGTADLGFYFVAKALQLAKPGGRIGLVQPRALLNADSARLLRRQLRDGPFRPNFLFAPERSDYFPGAAVFVCAVGLGPEATCRVGMGADDSSDHWALGRLGNENWWLALTELLGRSDAPTFPTGPRLGEVFEVAASMTTGDAYSIAPFVVDSREDIGPRLITTGMIEPGHSLWGQKKTRYLKKDYLCPRLDRTAPHGASVLRRLSNSGRPRILVAGLAKRIECFLDATGDCLGAVSTYTIFHPNDDRQSLEDLCAFLLSAWPSRRFASELGANAMGGGNTTMKQDFLKNLPLPATP